MKGAALSAMARRSSTAAQRGAQPTHRAESAGAFDCLQFERYDQPLRLSTLPRSRSKILLVETRNENDKRPGPSYGNMLTDDVRGTRHAVSVTSVGRPKKGKRGF